MNEISNEYLYKVQLKILELWKASYETVTAAQCLCAPPDYRSIVTATDRHNDKSRRPNEFIKPEKEVTIVSTSLPTGSP